MVAFDQDALTAAAELVSRSGASDLEIGYVNDDVPIEDAGWYATATYKGAKLSVENERHPVAAVEALARRILTGATCRRCGEPVRLDDDEPGCRWTRRGARWSGCGLDVDRTIPMPAFARKGSR